MNAETDGFPLIMVKKCEPIRLSDFCQYQAPAEHRQALPGGWAWMAKGQRLPAAAWQPGVLSAPLRDY